MSVIVKTEGIVLTKTDHGDTSQIISVYTYEFGKISCIIKGVKKSSARQGNIFDVLNRLQIVLYKKEHREMNLISQSDLLSFYAGIKSDLNLMKYAFSINELIYKEGFP